MLMVIQIWQQVISFEPKGTCFISAEQAVFTCSPNMVSLVRL
jgi:hypothetical protein